MEKPLSKDDLLKPRMPSILDKCKMEQQMIDQVLDQNTNNNES